MKSLKQKLALLLTCITVGACSFVITACSLPGNSSGDSSMESSTADSSTESSTENSSSVNTPVTPPAGPTDESGLTFVKSTITNDDDIYYYILTGMGTCTKTDITIPSMIYDDFEEDYLPVEEIRQDAFANKTTLTSITIPSSVKKVGNGVFYGCTNLETVIIEEGLTAIPYGMFQYCSSLKNLVIPKSVTSVGGYSVQGCDLTEFKKFYRGTEAELAEIDFDTLSYMSETGTTEVKGTFYFYEEFEPTTTGNYWHFVGGVPTVWA